MPVARLLVLAALLAAAAAAAGQSLGEAARQEQERRAKAPPKKPAPSFTDADLGTRRGAAPAEAASPSPSPSASASPGAAASPGPSPSPTLDDEAHERRMKEAEWRIRFANARERVSRAEAASWRTVIETVFVSGIPVQQPVRKFEETEDLRNAKAALADLEEEFRRTGLPAGWAR
jgi:hypothetical protein